MTTVRIVNGALALTLLQLGVFVGAETFSQAVSECREINSREQRYDCYDQAEAASGDVSRQVGNVNYESSADPVTGQTEHELTIRSSQGLNRGGDPIILEWRCASTRPGEYDFRLDWSAFMPSTSPEVTTRLGQTDSVTGRWQTGPSRESTILGGPDTGFTSAGFVQLLVGEVEADNTSMVFRTQPYNAEPITAVFDFSGFLDVFTPMRQACQF